MGGHATPGDHTGKPELSEKPGPQGGPSGALSPDRKSGLRHRAAAAGSQKTGRMILRHRSIQRRGLYHGLPARVGREPLYVCTPSRDLPFPHCL